MTRIGSVIKGTTLSGVYLTKAFKRITCALNPIGNMEVTCFDAFSLGQEGLFRPLRNASILSSPRAYFV